MLEMVSTKTRRPASSAICVVWHLRKVDTTDVLVVNAQFARFDYYDNVWRWLGNDEIVDEERIGPIVKYFEIPLSFQNIYLNKGTLWTRIKNHLCGIKQETYNENDFSLYM